MKKRYRLPTILAILFLTFGLGIGLILLQGKQIFRLGASPDTAPKNVRVTNLTDTSATVSWTTAKAVIGFVRWDESVSVQATVAQAETREAGFVHAVNLVGLAPAKSYFFEISSGGTEYDNEGVPWKIQTGPALEESRGQQIIAGTLLKATGSPAGGAVVYLSLPGVAPLSTTTSPNGSWVILLGPARNTDLTSYYSPREGDLVEIAAQAGPTGTSTAKAMVASASSLPPMILGQIHDFTALAVSSPAPGQEPTASIQPPTSDDTLAEYSGFALDEDIATPAATTVTLESLENGEVVTSNQPEFFGQGPKGIALSIKIESEAIITDEVTIGADGKWKWTPTEELSEGNHTLTLAWKDAGGVLKNITKSFIVEAAEKPAFVASGSATPGPTRAPEPVSGVSTPTILLALSALGFILLGGSTFLFSVRENK